MPTILIRGRERLGSTGVRGPGSVLVRSWLCTCRIPLDEDTRFRVEKWDDWFFLSDGRRTGNTSMLAATGSSFRSFPATGVRRSGALVQRDLLNAYAALDDVTEATARDRARDAAWRLQRERSKLREAERRRTRGPSRRPVHSPSPPLDTNGTAPQTVRLVGDPAEALAEPRTAVSSCPAGDRSSTGSADGSDWSSTGRTEGTSAITPAGGATVSTTVSRPMRRQQLPTLASGAAREDRERTGGAAGGASRPSGDHPTDGRDRLVPALGPASAARRHRRSRTWRDRPSGGTPPPDRGRRRARVRTGRRRSGARWRRTSPRRSRRTHAHPRTAP